MNDALGLPELVVVFGTYALLGFALMLLVGGLRAKQSRSVQRALIEKLPPEEVVRLLETPNGGKLVEALGEAAGTPAQSIIATVQRGIVALFVGAGMLAGSSKIPVAFLGALGMVLICAGAGLLVAAFASYRISKRWRLLDK